MSSRPGRFSRRSGEFGGASHRCGRQRRYTVAAMRARMVSAAGWFRSSYNDSAACHRRCAVSGSSPASVSAIPAKARACSKRSPASAASTRADSWCLRDSRARPASKRVAPRLLWMSVSMPWCPEPDGRHQVRADEFVEQRGRGGEVRARHRRGGVEVEIRARVGAQEPEEPSRPGGQRPVGPREDGSQRRPVGTAGVEHGQPPAFVPQLPHGVGEHHPGAASTAWSRPVSVSTTVRPATVACTTTSTTTRTTLTARTWSTSRTTRSTRAAGPGRCCRRSRSSAEPVVPGHPAGGHAAVLSGREGFRARRARAASDGRTPPYRGFR